MAGVSQHRSFVPRVLLRSAETANQVAVIESTVPAHWEGPPLHHHDFDETFYVLDGELTFQLGEELFRRDRGGVVFAPRGAHHAFANLNDAPASYLLICTPGGFERYFDRIAAEAAGVDPPPSASEPYPDVIVVGPRIGERGSGG